LPWEVRKKPGSKKTYQIVKKDGGKVVGEHLSQAEAQAQLRALYANTKE
jgi:hypothetical protein